MGYRWIVVVTVLATFALVSLVFHRLDSLSGNRGLTLFGLVDVVTFVASPGGADLLSLGQGRALITLLLSIALAAVLGFAASPFALSMTALLTTVASAVLSITGTSADQSGAGTILAVALAVVSARFVLPKR